MFSTIGCLNLIYSVGLCTNKKTKEVLLRYEMSSLKRKIYYKNARIRILKSCERTHLRRWKMGRKVSRVISFHHLINRLLPLSLSRRITLSHSTFFALTFLTHIYTHNIGRKPHCLLKQLTIYRTNYSSKQHRRKNHNTAGLQISK